MQPKKIIATVIVSLLVLTGIASPNDFLKLLTAVLQPLHGIYKVATETQWLQVVFYASLCALFFYLAVRKILKQHWSIYKSIILFFAAILFWEATWATQYTTFKECVLLICAIGLSVCFLFEIVLALVALNKKTNEKTETGAGLIEDLPNEKEDNDLGRKHFARTLAKRIISTNASQESFAVCINGTWGTGKTTFLNYLHDQIKKNSPNATILDFAPWLSSSPNQIIKDFFITLRKSLGVDDSGLDIDLKRYAGLLMSASSDVTSVLPNVINMFSKPVASLDELRNQINIKLSEINHKVYIFIDDVDRLDNDEVLETLRLIRNTAKFSHLVYIVAFDKAYVKNAIKSVLENENLADRYIDKIFQLEVTLPLYENITIYYELVDDLKNHLKLNNKDIAEITNEILSAPGRGLRIDEFLKTFRDAKRYANLLLVSISQFYEDGEHNDEISLRDLIWIELIHYCDLKLYSKLSDSPSSILKPRNESEHGDGHFVYEEPEKEKPYLNNVLKWLFPYKLEGRKDEKNSIRYYRNYHKYFALRPLASQASRNDFLEVLRRQDDSTMKEWLKALNEDEFDKSKSVYYLLLDVNMKELNMEGQVFYTKFLFEFLGLFRVNRSDIGNLFMLKYLSENFKPHAIKPIKEFLFKEYKEFTRDKENCITEAKILSSMYPYEWTDDIREGEEVIFPKCILNKEELESLSKENFMKFLGYGAFTSQELCSSVSPICKLIQASYSWSQDSSKPHRVKMLIADEFCKYTRELFTTDDAKKIMDYYKMLPSSDPYDTTPDNVYLENKIKQRFGDVTFYVKFITEGLHIEDIDKEGYLKDNMLSIYKKR